MPTYLYLVSFNQKKPMFLESEFMICWSLIGMKKKNLFNIKYVRVYLMLNVLKMKSFDYKSIALPAELQRASAMIIKNF